MNTNTWLIRREFWENRAIWLIPAGFGALLILAALFGQVSIPALNSNVETHDFGGIFLFAIGAVFYLVMSLYASWYLLECLYTDRKDRSILFWKSLPISDARTVLIKAIVALLIIPLVYFLTADATALIAAFIVSVRARASIGSALWDPNVWWQIQVLWIYVIFTTAVWYLPVAGWLLLVSAWAKRAVILWSILPPLALYLVERIFFGTHYVAWVLNSRLAGLPAAALRAGWKDGSDVEINGHVPDSIWRFLNASGFMTNPQTWIGIGAGAVLIMAAIQLRMRRSEI